MYGERARILEVICEQAWSDFGVCLVLGSFVSRAEAQELQIKDCPVAVASFGAAVCDGYLYVYGGNEGTANSFSLEGQNNVFRRVKLETGAEWESLGEVPRRQGNALVTFKADYTASAGSRRSIPLSRIRTWFRQRTFKSYDPATGKWTALAELPEPRSSFDAVVVGKMLYAVGGWSLNGKDGETKWLETAWKVDLGDPVPNGRRSRNHLLRSAQIPSARPRAKST